jgi:hypothetical protein
VSGIPRDRIIALLDQAQMALESAQASLTKRYDLIGGWGTYETGTAVFEANLIEARAAAEAAERAARKLA